MDDRPWLRFYGAVPASLDYPDVALHEALRETARRVPDATVLEYFRWRTTYRQLVAAVDRCAAALVALGVGAGDRVAIVLPTCPEAVIAVYAANTVGAVCAMIHPLSTASELAFLFARTAPRCIVALDACRPAVEAARARDATLVVAGAADSLGPLARAVYAVRRWRTHGRVRGGAVRWRALMTRATAPVAARPGRGDDAAVILFSGGTTGQPKGVVLTNRNVIAQGLQTAAWAGQRPGDRVLALLPVFHGFGLGVCVNATLMGGGTAILVPRFTAADVAALLRTKRPNLFVGVPTLFDALTREPALRGADLSGLRAVFCGADTLSPALKARVDALLAAGGGAARVREGYGLTEAVTAIMAMPLDHYREGSIGIPFPDMRAKLVAPGTQDEVPTGSTGELCVSGPAVMRGYLDEPEATAAVLRTHADGHVWLHTGDLARRDADGFFYFVCRAKRMIKSSGFSVYPADVEAVLARHPAVAEACVVGVPDEAQVERVHAIVVARPPAQTGAALADELIAHCRRELIKWSCPRTVEFREALPKTRIGKIDFKRLADDAAAAARDRDRAA